MGRLLRVAEAGGRTGAVIKVRVLLALSWQSRGEGGRALDAIAEALEAAERERFVRVFVDEGVPMKELLAKTRDALVGSDYKVGQRLSVEYVNFLLDAFAQDVKASTARSIAASPLAEPLSEREIEVLHLIDQGLSNQEIADRFVVALSTVKWHINNFFGKLGVRSRTQALSRARELTLL